MKSSLTKKINDMRSGDHACLIYENIDQQMAAILPFIQSGLAKKEACLYIANDRPLDEIKAAFRKQGIDVGAAMDSGALTFSENNMIGSDFVPREMISVLRAQMRKAIRNGYQGLRASGEMSWVLGAQCNSHQLLEYEGLLNSTFPTTLTGICQYSRTRFRPEVLRDILRTHPIVIVGDAVCRNLYCESHQIIQGLQDYGLNWMLDNLRRFHDLEESLRHMIQLRDEFVSVASHELRTPLTALRLRTDLEIRNLQRGYQMGDKEVRDFVESTSRQLESFQRLLESILDANLISKMGLQLRSGAFDLVKVLRSIIAWAESIYPSLRIHLEAPSSLTVEWDEARISQMVENLISNAAKYGNAKPVHVELAKTPKSAVLRVKDQGVGIAPEDQKRIFQLYERGVSYTKVSGFGIGLFIVDQIVSAHAGNIELQSELGKGSTFCVELPF